MIYLDYAANTPADEAVLVQFCETERRFFGNANAHHTAGAAAAAEMDRITHEMAALLHVSPAEILYTSGASESNNTALFGLTHDRRRALSSFRISLSHLTTAAECRAFMDAFDAVYRELTL